MTTFTIDELLAALTAAQPETEGDPAAMTMQQLCAATGWGDVTLARKLRVLIDAGQVECVRVPMMRIDGARTTVPAYKLAGANDGHH